MNVLFIYPDIINYFFHEGFVSFDVASLSASLKNISCKTALIHQTKKIKKEELLSRVRSFHPDLIIFSVTTNMYIDIYSYVQEWASWIKNDNAQVKIVCAGDYPTVFPDEVIDDQNMDMVCIGEAELSLVELCEKMRRKDNYLVTEGIWIKDDSGKVHKNKIRPPVSNLDVLPFPDRSIFDFKNLSPGGEAIVMLSRGCPFSCTYCCNVTLNKIYVDNGYKYVRSRSPQNSIQELQGILQEFNFIKRFSFHDFTLSLNKAWFREFAVEYKNKINLPYSCNLRPDLVSAEVVSLLKLSRCYQVRMAIESGNDYIRAKVLNRNITRKQLSNAFSLCKDAGLQVYSYNMLGLPFEDLGMMLETVKINADLNTDVSQVMIFYPWEKTQLYKTCKENNLILKKEKNRNYLREPILNCGIVKRNQTMFTQRYFRSLVVFYKSILKLPQSVFKIMDAILVNVMFSSFSSMTLLPVLTGFIDLIRKVKVLGRAAQTICRDNL